MNTNLLHQHVHHKIIKQIANNNNIQWLYRFTIIRDTQLKYRPYVLKLVYTVADDDLLSFINDMKTPMDVSTHIVPANKVNIHSFHT